MSTELTLVLLGVALALALTGTRTRTGRRSATWVRRIVRRQRRFHERRRRTVKPIDRTRQRRAQRRRANR